MNQPTGAHDWSHRQTGRIALQRLPGTSATPAIHLTARRTVPRSTLAVIAKCCLQCLVNRVVSGVRSRVVLGICSGEERRIGTRNGCRMSIAIVSFMPKIRTIPRVPPVPVVSRRFLDNNVSQRAGKRSVKRWNRNPQTGVPNTILTTHQFPNSITILSFILHARSCFNPAAPRCELGSEQIGTSFGLDLVIPWLLLCLRQSQLRPRNPIRNW